MPEFQLPPTNEYPDQVDFDTRVIAWEFEVGGKPARLGFIQPDFEGELPVAEDGEQITLRNPSRGTALTVIELDDNGAVRRQYEPLTEHDEQVYIPGGGRVRLATAGRIAEYVSVSLGEPVRRAAEQPATAPEAEQPVNQDLATITREICEAGNGKVSVDQALWALYGQGRIEQSEYGKLVENMERLAEEGVLVPAGSKLYKLAGSPSPARTQRTTDDFDKMLKRGLSGNLGKPGKSRGRGRRNQRGK
jgi:hypothetical protein